MLLHFRLKIQESLGGVTVWLLEPVTLLQMTLAGSSVKAGGIILGAIGNRARQEPGPGGFVVQS